MNMDVGFAAIWVPCKHKQIIYTGIPQSFYGTDYDFQQFLGPIVLKIFQRVDMKFF